MDEVKVLPRSTLTELLVTDCIRAIRRYNESMAEQRYFEKTTQVANECRTNADVWKKQKLEYDQLYDRLESLHNKLTHEIMVPIGSVALMPGRIIHPGEVLVLLGDNWFVECPTSRALAIVKRRVNYCDERIKDFTDELQMFENCLKFKATLEPEEVEIKEDFDQQAEEKWKQQRKEKLKEKSAAKPPELDSALKSPSQVPQKDFDALLKRLDELEMLETAEDQSSSDRSETESDENSSDESKDKIPRKSVRFTDATTKTFDKDARVEDLTALPAAAETPAQVQLISNEESEFSSMPKSILKATDYEAPKNVTFPADLEVVEDRTKVILPGSASAFTGEIVERSSKDEDNTEETVVSAPTPTAKLSKFKLQKLRKQTAE